MGVNVQAAGAARSRRSRWAAMTRRERGAVRRRAALDRRRSLERSRPVAGVVALPDYLGPWWRRAWRRMVAWWRAWTG